MVGRSVTLLSDDGYKRHWYKWIDFLGTVAAHRRAQIFLQDEKEVQDKVKWLVLFAAYLRDIRGVTGS